VHAPNESRPETEARFVKKKQDKPEAFRDFDPTYAAMVFDLDGSVGLLLKELDDLGIADKTIVIFSSTDAAGFKTSENFLRGNKAAYYEAGIRVPLIVDWPGVTKPASVCDVPVTAADFLPTFFHALGVAIPNGVEGEDLAPLLSQTGALSRKSIFFFYPGYNPGDMYRGREIDQRTKFKTRPVGVIRKGDWKLMLWLEEWQLDAHFDTAQAIPTHAVELYNLKDDPSETWDQAESDPARSSKMLAELLACMDASKAPTHLQPNPAYKPGTKAPASFTLTYDANGGGGSVVDEGNPYPLHATVTLAAPKNLARPGYTFAGWNTSASGLGAAVKPGANFTIIGNETLYAQWSQTTVHD